MKIEKGDKVRFHFTGKFDNGDIFSSSKDKEPLEYEIGKANILKPIEDGLIGMKESEKKEIFVSAEQGYGNKDQRLVRKVPAKMLKEPTFVIGQHIKVKTENEQVITAKVVDIGRDTVTIDLNHPLAGKNLNFEVEVVEVKK